MAEAAVLARAPFWVVGRPYSATDPYFLRFQELAARHPEVIRYEGGISDRARLALVYRQARGFVLLSAMESQSLSACEAAACGCPLLLSDLPWARCTFGSAATYCPVTSVPETAEVMQGFYRMAPTLPAPPRPPGWAEVAASLEQIYASVLRGPSPAAG